MAELIRPSVAEIHRLIKNSVRCQMHNTQAGRKLHELDPAAHASLEDQLSGNLAQLVDGILTDATGIE